MSKLQAIVFDLDDTLFPESSYVLSGFQAVANWADQCLQIPAESAFEELKTIFQSNVRGVIFNQWLEQHKLQAEDYVQIMVNIYRTHTPVLTCFSDVLSVLTYHQPRYRLGLVSDGYLDVQQKKFDALGLKEYFNAVVFSDQFGREFWKPSPKPFEAVLNALDAQPEEAVYIGDNPLKDFLGAKQLGMKTIWCRRAEGQYRHLEPPSPLHAPYITIDSLEQLAQTLMELDETN